jgi:hypothetical protein
MNGALPSAIAPAHFYIKAKKQNLRGRQKKLLIEIESTSVAHSPPVGVGWALPTVFDLATIH